MQYLYQNLINLRKIAIHNRLSDSVEVYIEKCYRYFSKTYNMPLDAVKEKYTPEEVVLVFMEDELIEWTPEEIFRLRDTLSSADRPVIEDLAVTTVELSDDEWVAQQEALLKAESKKKEDVAKKTHDVIEQLTKSFKSLTKDLENG